MQHCRNDERSHVHGLPPAQADASAWRGPQLAATDEWIVNLSREHVDELAHATTAAIARGLDPARLTALDFPLPALAAELDSLRDELLHGRGFALLRGLPIERFTRRQAAALFMGLGAHLGHARSQNAKGHLLGHVCDLGLESSDPNVRIYQTHERQTFHTDSCDVVGLLCLREARSGGDSLLVSAATIFNEMRARRPDLLARLLRPMAHDRRGEVPTGMQPWFELPVFSWHAGELTVFYQRQYIDSAQRFPDAPRLTDYDVEALDLFDALANGPQLHLTMRLAPGDIQFVHNHTLLHDRTGFVDWPEPDRRRHLLRLWLACPGARELPPAFAARYGSITVGDRGGIVAPGTQLNVPLEPG
jgi:alpha-ketoglutarate-dependent taurine dioxygenase